MSPNEKIVRIRTVLARTGLSRSTLYRKIAEGTFPRQVGYRGYEDDRRP